MVRYYTDGVDFLERGWDGNFFPRTIRKESGTSYQMLTAGNRLVTGILNSSLEVPL